MFYISLPFFYENFDFNNFFKNYVEKCRTNKQDKLIANFEIEYVYGAFPWSYWNGGISNHQGAAALALDMQLIISETKAPLRIDASNIHLQEIDYCDIHENITLKIANGANVAYEISDISLMEYIAKRNINNKFIISNNAQLLYLFNTDILNIFQERSEIDFINIGHNPFNQLKDNIDFSKIKDKDKLEISIGHCQNCSFEKHLHCIEEEQKNIYNYSNQSFFINCPYKCKSLNYYKEIEPYLKQGIKHFKIIVSPSDLKNFNINIIKSFVKPEYQGECINEYYREISK